MRANVKKVHEIETRDKILKAAEDTFAREGYSGSSIKAIATEAGVTGAMIHYYFESKEKLYYAVLDHIVADFEAMAHEIVGTKKPPVERLKIYFNWLFEYAVQHPNLSRLMVMGIGGVESAYFENVVERCLKPLFEMGVGFVEKGIEQEIFRRVDAKHLLVAFYGMMLPYFTDHRFFTMLIGNEALSEDELEKRKKCLVDILFCALGVELTPEYGKVLPLPTVKITTA